MGGMIIDGVAASEDIDSSGEIIEIDGIDISDFENGVGTLNYEHRNEKDAGASANDILGRIVEAKKIFEKKDCENERQRDYWDKTKLPFLYIKAELFDADGHPGAIATAAIIRHYHTRNLPVLVRYSIEGTTLARDGNKIKKCVAKKVACTIKPCNKAAVSSVVEDPAEKKGKSIVEQLQRNELRRPDEEFLGGYEGEYQPFVSAPTGFEQLSKAAKRLDETLAKMLTAGGVGGPPSGLTGGAALAREDLGSRKKRIEFAKNQVLAAYRDWSGVIPFKEHIKKHKLGDASDEFIDHFADLVEDYHVRKAEEPLPPIQAAEGEPPVATKKPRAPTEIKNQSYDKFLAEPLTWRGKKLRPSKVLKPSTAYVDVRAGALHTPGGTFAFYNPDKDPHNPKAGEYFRQIISDPKNVAAHGRAVENWKRLNALLQSGQMPHEILAHAAHFSILSANQAVPVQELMYSYLQDILRDHGKEALTTDLETLRPAFKAKKGTMPVHARDYFEGQAKDAISTKSGQVKPMGFEDHAFDFLVRYQQDHGILREALKRYGPNGRAAVSYILGSKGEGRLLGLANKTTRYAYSMVGAGNMVVPDTHFVRHLFGLHQGTDKDSIEYLKGLLWGDSANPILEKIDQWYQHNHPAVKFVQDKHFGGQNTEDAIFPAFWLHWMSIKPHERAIKAPSRGVASNEYTDHTPYWLVANEILAKYGLLNEGEIQKSVSESEAPLAMRTAAAASELEQRLGGGMWVPYYSHIIPILLDHSRAEQLGKSEPVDLFKAEPTGDAPRVFRFQGHRIDPGVLTLKDHQGNAVASLPLLGSVDGYHYVQSADGIRKLHDAYEGVGFSVDKLPAKSFGQRLVDEREHSDSSLIHDEQRMLIHGLDLDRLKNGWGSPAAGGYSHVAPALDPTHFVRDLESIHEFPSSRRDAVFYNTAKSYWGLGDHVVPVAHFNHPDTGEPHAATAFVPGARHFEMSSRGGSHAINPNHETADILSSAGDSGVLDKLAIMDHVMGMSDRPMSHVLTTSAPVPSLKLIHSGLAFGDNAQVPSYLLHYHRLRDRTMHPEELRHVPFAAGVAPWVAGLEPQKLAEHLLAQGVPRRLVENAVDRLISVQDKFSQVNSLNRGEVFRHRENDDA